MNKRITYRKRKKNNYFPTSFWRYFTWVLTGIVVAFSLTSIFISGKFSLRYLYDVGDVYEIQDAYYLSASEQENGHRESSGKVVLDKGEFIYSVNIYGNTDQWNYFCVQLDNLSEETVHWNVSYVLQGNDEASESYSYELVEGANYIPVAKNTFNLINIEIIGPDGTSFDITDMQLRENKPVFSWGKAIAVFAGAFIGFCCLSAFIFVVLKKSKIRCNPYCWIDILQDLYILIAEQFRKLVSFIPQSGHIRNYCRTALFLLIFLYSVYVEIAGTYYRSFKYHLVIYAVLLLLIAALSIKASLKKVNWNNPLVWSWLVLFIMTAISDFLVSKFFAYVGYVIILIIGFLIFIWNNMKKSSEIIADFVRAVHLFLVISTLFCLIFRPESGELRYSGFTGNPSIFALYMATCWGVTLGELESRVRKGQQLKKILPYVVELCVIISFCWKSQSAGPVLCMTGMTFIWLFKMVRYTRGKVLRKSLVTVVLSVGILIFPVYGGLTWGLQNISPALEAKVTFEGETQIARTNFGPVVYAAEQSRLAQKFSSSSLSQILSGRDYYWRTYLRDMNLVGHERNPVMWGHIRLPHNSLLGIAHRYGVFSVVPYVIMLAATIVGTIRFGRKRVRYSTVPFYVCLSSIIMSLFDNVEQPFVWLPWIGMYLMMGCAFANFGKSTDVARRRKTIKS